MPIQTADEIESTHAAIDGLVRTLTSARYKILVSIRPLAGASDALGLVVNEFAQHIRKSYGDDHAAYFTDKFEVAGGDHALPDND